MKKFMLITALVVALAAMSASAATYNWTGASAADPFAWNDADNWDVGGSFPNAAVDVANVPTDGVQAKKVGSEAEA